MILGRSLTLWTGAVAAVLNAFVLANLVVLSGDQVAASMLPCSPSSP